jgi:hypothetical protein
MILTINSQVFTVTYEIASHTLMLQWRMFLSNWNFSFFLASFLSRSSFCLIILGVDGYFCMWTQTVRHTYSVDHPWTSDQPVVEASRCNSTQHSQEKTSMPTAGFFNSLCFLSLCTLSLLLSLSCLSWPLPFVLIVQYTYITQTSMVPAGFEPAIPASERP